MRVAFGRSLSATFAASLRGKVSRISRNEPMSRAEDLYQKLLREGVRAVDQLIADRQSEELFLDFKRSADNASGSKLHDNDRKNFARAISGFGNSEGGVLVWGVDCSQDRDGADVAHMKVPLLNAARFKSLLEGAVSGATIPPHARVQIAHVLEGTGPEGYVYCLIPRSNHLPHQSVARLQYYMRSGSDFVPVPHGVLAGMFGKSPQPHVFINYLSGPASLSGDQVRASLGFMLANDGPGVASDLFLSLTIVSVPGPNCKVSFELPDQQNWTGNFSFGVKLALVSKSDYRLAPDALCQPAVMNVVLAPPFESSFRIKGIGGSGSSEPYRFDYEKPVDEVKALYYGFADSSQKGILQPGQRQEFVIDLLDIPKQ